MLNRWWPSRDAAITHVVIALLFSLLLHFIMLGLIHVDMSIFKPEQEFVEVRFAHLVKTPPPVSAIVKQPQSAPEAVAPEPKLESKKPEPEISTAPQPSSETVPSITSEPDLNSEQPSQAATVEIPTQAPEKIEPEPAEIIADSEPLESDAQPYEDIEADFDILRGQDGYKVGQSKVRYQSREGSYLLLSESEAKGFASLFLSGKLIQRSEGSVTERGLQPHEFLYQYGKSGKKQRALFDWDNRRLTLETDKVSQASRLPSDTQDLMSFMYQFMFVPPLEEMQLNITNGKRLKAYGYSFVGEEELSTKMGVVRAMHIENINDDGDEKNEIWLAVDYRFLPVKIRKTEKDGSVIEQVMTNLKTDIVQ